MVFPLWAQNEFDDFSDDFEIAPEEPQEPAKPPFRMKNRMVELSAPNLSYGISNTFLAARDIINNPFYLLWNIGDIIDDPSRIYRDPVVIDIDDFLNGFKFNVNMAIKPVSLNFNWKDQWGFGLDIGHIDVWGNLAIPDTVLRTKETKSATFGAGGAAFVDVGIPVFFHINNAKIKIRPAVYVPLIYTEPSFKYRYQETGEDDDTFSGMRLEVDYSMCIYSLVDLGDIEQSFADNAWNIPRDNFGYDFGLCVEYPWSDRLDLGINVVNIPVPYAAAKLNYYTQINGKISLDTSSIDLESESGKFDFNEEELWQIDEMEFIAGDERVNKTIYRPFVLLFYADYRPSYSRPLSLIPSLGFSINWLYVEPASIEGGLSVRYDFINMIITTVGINYNDRVFKNSIDVAFNFRAVEIDLGLSAQSPNLVKSWQGAGIGVNFGLKFGW
jgi:hypothetical protein